LAVSVIAIDGSKRHIEFILVIDFLCLFAFTIAKILTEIYGKKAGTLSG